MVQFEITENKNLPKFQKIEETMDRYIPKVDRSMNIPNLTGFRYCICGPPGSGKSNLLLNLFKTDKFYRNKFKNVYLFTPQSSFESVKDHLFKDHPDVFHEMSAELIYAIIDELQAKKMAYVDYMKSKNKKQPKLFIDDDDKPERKKKVSLEWSCIILDDMANELKNQEFVKALKKLLIQTRHIMCSVIITLQSYLLLDKKLRKLMNYVTVFKPSHQHEWISNCDELIGISNQNDMLEIQNYLFNENYNHLDIDITHGKFYKNFNDLKISFSQRGEIGL